MAKFWFGSVASLKFDCLVKTGVVAIVSLQILSLDKNCMDKCCTDRCCMDKCCMDKCCMVKWYWATCQQSRMLYQLSLLSLNYYPGGVGGWVGGSNGNKANLSPAEAGAGLSLAISASLNNLFQIGCTIISCLPNWARKKCCWENG